MKLRMTALLFSMILLLSWGFSAQAVGLSKEEKYEASLQELKAYLDGDTSTPLNTLIENFDGLGRYQMSIDLSLYTRILRDIEMNHFTDVSLYIRILKMDPDFPVFLEENELGSLEELEKYAAARESHYRGNYSEAAEYYEGCMGFMDSMIHYRELLPILEAGEKKATPTPTSRKRTAAPKKTATPKPAATPCAHSTIEVEGERQDLGDDEWIQECYDVCIYCGEITNTFYIGGMRIDAIIPTVTNSVEIEDDGRPGKPVS